MCSIAGVVERGVRSAALLEEIARKMAAPLVHRGPDADGVWTDADTGVGIGHRRLSIIDLSPAGAQPMVSASGRLAISYNGEIYNAAELRAELEARGVRFRGHSDTEVLLEACAAWGVERAARRLIGMFAFAVWDRGERCLYLVRDRIGIKPLYYRATAERFSFASELTGLRAHPEFRAEIDRDAVDAFLALDYIPTPYSIYRGVRKLEPGTILRVDFGALDRVEIAPYWTLEEAARKGAADRFAGTFEEAADELERLLSDAVKRRMISDVPLGAFLSGGIDSSTVVALMQRQSAKPVKTFTIGFSEGAFDEAAHARAIAQHLGTDHCEHYVTDEEIREHGPAIIGHHDEPFADTSLLPTRFLSRLARREVTVALSGDGGDELFGGYPRHLAAERILGHPALEFGPVAKSLIHRSIPRAPRPLRSGLWALLEKDADPSKRLKAGEIKHLARGIHCPRLLHHSLAHGNVGLLRGRVDGPRIAVNPVNRWIGESEALTPSERQQYIDTAGYLPDNILTKVDRASMAVSLEVRVPVLDHRIVEFAFRLPPAMKTDGLETKHTLRTVLNRHLPKSMFERPKQGFRAPVGAWLRGPLREWADGLVSGALASQQGIVDRRAMSSTLRRLRVGRCTQTDFRRIALAAWCKPVISGHVQKSGSQ